MAVNSLAAAVCFYENAWGGCAPWSSRIDHSQGWLSGDAEAVAIRSSRSVPPRALHSRLAALVIIVSFKRKSR